MKALEPARTEVTREPEQWTSQGFSASDVKMAMAYLGWAASAALFLFATSCVDPPAGALRIVGPDGTSMLHVHCADEQVACFQLAGERCPHGYDLSPIFDPHDGNFLVRCRDPQAEAVIITKRAAPATRPTRVNPSSGSATDQWPPQEVATPSEPWPAPSASATPPAVGAVDIGY